MEKKLYRDETRKKIGGVCAGLADYFDMDVAIIRALFVLTFVFMGTGFMAYLVLWVVIPARRGYFNPANPGVDYRVNPEANFNPFSGGEPAGQGKPFNYVAPKKQSSSSAGIVFGMILIFMGGAFLLHELDLFRFWHVAKAWPAILVVGGLAMIVSGQKKQPWEKEGWQHANEAGTQPADSAPAAEEKKDDNFTDTPTTI
jgi:phage shock protein C